MQRSIIARVDSNTTVGEFQNAKSYDSTGYIDCGSFRLRYWVHISES